MNPSRVTNVDESRIENDFQIRIRQARLIQMPRLHGLLLFTALVHALQRHLHPKHQHVFDRRRRIHDRVRGDPTM